ncbi:response regulator transcription factor [Pseudonocardia sp. CA-107938]|uniref:response regulator transcription factor n=1 Tax=Pseudonocardia sp. CA-107938 TaxID=3240021 RepID=UPI003D8D3135
MTIADDHPLFLDGLRAWLGEIGVEVLATARNAAELVAAVRADPPDVVVTDVAMAPSFTDEGLLAVEELAADHPDVGMLVLSAHREPDWVLRLVSLRPRGVGYLLKHNVTRASLLQDSLSRLVDGGVVIDPEIVADVVAPRTSPLEALTPRERLVLAHAAQGRSNRGIAVELGITERTVENHISRIFTKLRLPDGNQRVLAILEWQRAHGWGNTQPQA